MFFCFGQPLCFTSGLNGILKVLLFIYCPIAVLSSLSHSFFFKIISMRQPGDELVFTSTEFMHIDTALQPKNSNKTTLNVMHILFQFLNELV